MKVKCIDNKMMMPGVLTAGNIYEVQSEDSLSYKLIDDLGRDMHFAKERFKIVEEDNKVEREVFKGWELVKMIGERKLPNGTLLQDEEGEYYTVINHCLLDGKREKFDNKYETSFSFLPFSEFKFIRKEYTFEEAYKYYERGKEIKSYDGSRFKKIDGQDHTWFDGKWLNFNNGISFSIKQIRNKWYIND